MSNKLKEFLLKNEVSKDEEFTHTSLNSDTPAGKYNISADKSDKLRKIYAEHIFIKGKNAYLTERHPKKYSKPFIDIDLRYQNTTTRQYTENLIKDLVTNYQDVFQELLGQNGTREELLAYVMEKEGPEYDEEKKILKDGIHIMFPNLYISYKAQHWARKNVIEKMREHPDILACCTPIEQIIDESVVERNNVIMYGSRKNNKAFAYILTRIYDSEIDECELPEDDEELLKLLSLQHRSHETPTLIDQILENEKTITSATQQLEVITQLTTPNLVAKKSKAYMKSLLSLLKPNRFENYDEWLRIGAILYNESEDYLDLFKEWSSQSVKYNESHCDKLWNKTYPNHSEDRRARIGSLQMMAREDSPTNYYAVMEKFESEDELTLTIIRSLRNTHAEFADLVYQLLKDKYRFSNDNWYCFDVNRWRMLSSNIPLMKDISLTVRNVLFRYSSMLSLKIADVQVQSGAPIPETEPIMIRKAACEKAINNLKDNTYKGKVVNESKEFFYNEEFFKNLDMNIYLLGFNNGVYNLQKGEFRDVLPDDNISFSTGYDYTPNIIPEIRSVIIDLFDKSLPDKSVREFTLTFLASTLIGRNKNELFVNFEGSGGNGKGVITTLHDYALGDYAGTLDNAYLTNTSSSQESHNSKLISIFKKRYVQVNEPPKGKTLNQDFIKELTGNDKMQIRKAHASDPETSDSAMFKLVMLCNKMPRIEDTQDGGFLRRYKGINFPNRFVDREPTKINEFRADPNLKTKLKEDVRYRQQYMNILLEYVKIYIRNDEKIEIPEEVERNTKSILQAQDYYSEFVDFNLEITGNEEDNMTVKELLEEFHSYYKEFVSGGSKPPAITQTEFMERMKRCFASYQVEFKNNITAGGHRRGKGFVGVKIKEFSN